MTCSARAELESAAGGQTLLLTGDRDMYQCVTENTHVLYLKRAGSGFETVDAVEVERRYGIPPALVPDFIALRGDPSDGHAGRARHRPEKTAATCCVSTARWRNSLTRRSPARRWRASTHRPRAPETRRRATRLP